MSAYYTVSVSSVSLPLGKKIVIAVRADRAVVLRHGQPVIAHADVRDRAVRTLDAVFLGVTRAVRDSICISLFFIGVFCLRIPLDV